MRLKVIACKVFTREISLLAARSDAVLDVTWIRQGLHNCPGLLREEIRREIRNAESDPDGPNRIARPPEDYSAIVLGFGLCSRAVSEITTSRLPLVVPRCHDCVGILLGSRRRYREFFDAHPGTYWLSPGWIEQATFPCGEQCAIMRSRYVEQFGEDNGEFLMRTEHEALRPYSRAVLVTWPELDRPEYHARLAEVARDFGWDSECLEGDSGLLERMLNGVWDPEEVLVCPPGWSIEAGDDGDEVLRAVERAAARANDT